MKPGSSVTSKRPPWRLIIGLGVVTLISASLAILLPTLLRKKPSVAGELLVLKRNGGWCWFQDERAIVDAGRVLVGTVAGTNRDGSSQGDVEVTSYELSSRRSQSFRLHRRLQFDDHISPALLRMNDGRYLATYTRHAQDALMRWRVSSRPGDATEWEEEKTLDVGAAVTYSNLAQLDDQRIYNFYRSKQSNPHFMTSTDAAASFRVEGRLLSWTRNSPSFDQNKSTRTSEAKPYARYTVSALPSRAPEIHFITTEDHPRAYDNGVYHGFVREGVLYDSFGQVIDNDIFDGEPVELTRLTRIFNGDRDNVAWVVDLEVDDDGLPFVAFAVQKDGRGRASKQALGGKDHRYHYARFTGTAWISNEIAFAGGGLYEHEVNYTGLVALARQDPNVLFLSADLDPATGLPLSVGDAGRKFEIFRGDTTDRGRTWTFSQLTRDSKKNNIRPIVPHWNESILLLWLRGEYTTMSRFDLDVVGLLDPARG